MRLKRSDPAAAPRCIAVLAFAVGVALSLAVAALHSRRNAEQAQARFDVLAARSVADLRQRMQTYEYGLRGARGALIGAGIERITRERFREYAASREVEQEFPGAHGFGVIRRVPVQDEAAFIAAARADGMPEFALRALQPHATERYVIQYIEPVARNQQAVGLDVASEAHRRAAAQQAMRTGRATLTAPITLIQASGAPQRSFLLLLPVYRPGLSVDSEAAREVATFGWVYAPLVIDEVLADFDLHGDAFALRLHDASAGDDAFFELSGRSVAAPDAPTARIPIELYGRRWEAELRALPPFVAALNQTDTRAVALAGVAASALVAVLLQMVLVNAWRTRQARAERSRRAAIVASSHDAIVAADVHGVVTDWNAGAEHLFGYSAAEAVGRSVAELVMPADRLGEELRFAAGEAVPPHDTVRRRRDGRLIDVSIAASPIRAADGVLVGYAKTVRDISDRKAVEAAQSRATAELERLVAERTVQLQAASRDMQNILDAVPSVIGYWDSRQHVRFANRAYCEWFGIDPARLPDMTIREVLADRYEKIRPHVEAALAGQPQRFERDLPRPEGGPPRRVITHYLPDVFDGEVRGFYGLLQDITEQTDDKARLAAALRDNEALLGTLRIHAIFSAVDRTGRVIDVNDGFCRTSGFRRDELIGQDHRIVDAGEQSPEFWDEMWRTISSGRPWRGVICNRAKKGSRYWVDSLIAPFIDVDGGIEKYISIGFDITAAKHAEALLHQTNERLRLASQSVRIGVWEWGLADNTLVCDEQMYALFRRTPAAGAEQFTEWSAAVHPEDWGRVESALAAARQPGGEFDAEFRIRWPDGEVRHVRAAAVVVRDEAGAARRMTGVSLDTTERARAELELRETGALLRNVLDSASAVSIIATDRQGCITLFNRGAEQLLGYAADEVVGRLDARDLHDLQELQARAAEMSAALGRPVVAPLVDESVLGQPREWTYLRKDGRRLTMSLAVTAIRTADGRVAGYLGVGHDVTERKRQEESLRQAMRRAEQANLAKSQFLANVSHEIRTPMNAVIGLSYLLEQTRLDGEQQATLAKMKLAGQSLLGVINDVLDLSKIEAGEFVIEQVAFDPICLLDDVRKVMDVQALSKRIELSVHVPDTLPRRLVGDATRLQQVLTNLLSNAIKFTDDGSVRLNVHCEPAPPSVRVRFEVRDTGIGIPQELHARLFTPFTQADASTTRRYGGTGLGLSIVKRIVELMGGKVGLHSEVGRGSLFWVELGMALPGVGSDDDAAPQNALATVPGERALEGVHVLIIDDSEVNLEVARGMLERAGTTCSLASNGQEALDALRAGASGIDLVLMDVQMPLLDGIEATRRIRSELGLALPIVALTAGALVSERQRALSAGMNDFLSKPFEPRALIDVVRRHVGAPSRAAAAPAAPAAPRLRDTGWPDIEGIDLAAVMERLDGDLGLFAGMLARLFEQHLDVPEFWSHPTAARMHRLRGAAGMLGALGVQGAAEAAEEALQADDATDSAEWLEAVRVLLLRLREAAAPLIAAQQRRCDAGTHEAVGWDGAALKRLVELLDANDLAGLDVYERLKPALRSRLGEPVFLRLHHQIDALRFAEAAELLSDLGTMPPGNA